MCANGVTWSASELVQDKTVAKNLSPEERIGYKVILEARKGGVMIPRWATSSS